VTHALAFAGFECVVLAHRCLRPAAQAQPMLAAALVGIGIGLMFVLFEVGVETLLLARAQ
jgi:hypothetical protein